MTPNEFISKVLMTSDQFNFLFDCHGNLKLILTIDNDYLTELEIADYLSIRPDLYDMIIKLQYNEIVDINISKIGEYIRELFGLCHPNNPNVNYNDNVYDDNSPENVSCRILKKLWFNVNI